MLDIEVLVRGMQLAAAAGNQADAESACEVETTPFDGVELAAHATGLPVDITRAALLAGSVELPVGLALRRRGSLVVNTAGRVGIVVGPGQVLQPAGRVYAITDAGGSWVSGWWPGQVTLTISTPTPLPVGVKVGRIPGGPSGVATGDAEAVTVGATVDGDGVVGIPATSVLTVTSTRGAGGASNNLTLLSGAAALPVTATRVAAGGTTNGAAVTITAGTTGAGVAAKASPSTVTAVTVTRPASAAGTIGAPSTPITVTGGRSSAGRTGIAGPSAAAAVTALLGAGGNVPRASGSTPATVTATRAGAGRAEKSQASTALTVTATRNAVGVAAPGGFVVGVTKPDATNTGIAGYAAINGTRTRTTLNSNITLTAGQTLADTDVHGIITVTGSNVTIRNCTVAQLSNSYAGPAMINCSAAVTGVLIEFCTIAQDPNTSCFWFNGIRIRSGAQVTVSRCDIGHTPDGISVGDTTTAKGTIVGNYFHDRAFFSNSTDHSTDVAHPYWEHMDCIQVTGGQFAAGSGHIIRGNTIDARLSHTVGQISRAATYSVTGQGASVYDAEAVAGGWGNGITLSPDNGPIAGVLMENNWLDYGQSSFQMNSANGGVTAVGTIRNNAFGYGQGNFATLPTVDNYQIRYNTGLAMLEELTNYFDADAVTVPVGMRGRLFTVGGLGAGIRRN